MATARLLHFTTIGLGVGFYIIVVEGTVTFREPREVLVVRGHLLVKLWVLKFDVLVEGALRAIGLGAFLNRAFVMARDLCSGTSMALAFLLGDVKCHPKGLLVLSLVRLKYNKNTGQPSFSQTIKKKLFTNLSRPYLEPI